MGSTACWSSPASGNALPFRSSPARMRRLLGNLATRLAASEGAGTGRFRYVIDPGGLLDLWAEEDSYRPERIGVFVLAQGPRQLSIEVGRSLAASGLDYALTGAAAASIIAPFVTAVPVAEVWVTERAAPGRLPEAAGGEAAG